MNRHLLSCGVFIDLKKAFDTVDHNVLLDKPNHYGFHGIINSWFSSYLKNRTQTMQVDLVSDKAVVGCGVPQGSVLGPLNMQFIHTLLMLPKWVFQLNRIKLQIYI